MIRLSIIHTRILKQTLFSDIRQELNFPSSLLQAHRNRPLCAKNQSPANLCRITLAVDHHSHNLTHCFRNFPMRQFSSFLMLFQKYACTRLVSTCSFLRLLSLSLITELLSHTLTLLLLLSSSSALPMPYLELLRFLSPSLSFLFCYSLFLRLFPSLPLLLCRYALRLSLFAQLSSRCKRSKY